MYQTLDPTESSRALEMERIESFVNNNSQSRLKNVKSVEMQKSIDFENEIPLEENEQDVHRDCRERYSLRALPFMQSPMQIRTLDKINFPGWAIGIASFISIILVIILILILIVLFRH